MGGEVDAHQLALLVQSLDVAPAVIGLGDGWCLNLYLVESAEERILCLHLLLLIGLPVAHDGLDEGLALGILCKEVFATDTEAVESATQRQHFEGLAVDILQTDTLHKVEDVVIGTILLAFVDDRLCCAIAQSLDACQSEAYLAMLVDTKLEVRLIDIGPQRRDAHLLALVHELGDFRNLVATAAHDGSHELGGIVGLEIGRLIGHPRIAGSMRLVEGVGGELLPVGPYLLKNLRIVSVFLATLDEFRLHGVDDVLLLLTHRLTQGIALATGEVGQLSAQEHHLLLIDGDAVGVLEVFLHAVDGVGDGLQAVFTLDEVGDVVHGARTIEGIHGDEILEDGGVQLTQILLHACRLELEGADGLALLIELEGLGVVDGDGVEVYVDATGLLDDSTGLLHLREGLQAEEVHLDESCRLDDMAVVLGTVGLGVLEVGVVGSRHGHPVANRVAADDEATGMDARATHGALEHLGILDGVGQSRIGAGLGLAQLGGTLDGVGQIHLQVVARDGVFQPVGNGLAQCIDRVQRHLLYACHILDAVLGGHGGIGDDVGTVLVAVFVFHPFQHTASSVVVEVGIDIGQRDTVGVQETLEQQVVFQRVDLGDAQTVGHHRACGRATAGTYHHAQLVAGRVDEVLHDEEVARETHRLHDVQLEADAVVDLGGE